MAIELTILKVVSIAALLLSIGIGVGITCAWLTDWWRNR